MMEVNAKSTFRLPEAVLPELKKTGEGRFIVFVSMAGKDVKHETANGKRIAYAASKQAQLAI